MQSEVMEPAVKGTLNILEVCSSMKVQKVVVVSSTSTVHFNPNWPQGKPKDESCWSDKKVCIENEVSNVGIQNCELPEKMETSHMCW
jgi:nucleoside-diphosphate-sugar epimerase